MVIFTSAACEEKKIDTNGIILTAKRHKNMCKADIMGMPSTRLACQSVIGNDPLLFHKWFGHTSLKQLNKLNSKDMMVGLSKTKFKEEKVCNACIRGEKVRSYLKSRTTSVQPSVLIWPIWTLVDQWEYKAEKARCMFL